MKRIMMIALFLLISFCLPVMANETVIDVTAEATLGDINLVFCNEGQEKSKLLKLSVESGAQAQICVTISNESSYEANVALNFIDGSITNDDNQNKSCKLEGDKVMFGQYVSGFSLDRLTLAPRSSQTLTGFIQFPEGYAGNIPGCVTYFLVEGDSNQQGMLKVLSRKANIIEALVQGNPTSSFGLLSLNGKYNDSMGVNILNNEFFGLYRMSDGLKFAFEPINTGNVPQLFTYELKVDGMVGYSLYETGSRTILPNESALQNILLTKLPWYVWNVSINLSGTASAAIPQGMSVGTGFNPNPVVITENVSVSIMTWVHILSLLVLLLILLLLIIFLRRKKKTVAQDQTNNVSNTNTTPSY